MPPSTPTSAQSPASWPHSPVGSYVLSWQAERYALASAGIFGYYALQLGCPALPALAASRVAQRWLALQHEDADFACPQLRLDFHQLPLQESSVDLLALPHTLENSADPEATLRDTARALRPQGRLLISGFNPRSVWFSPAAQQRRKLWGLPEPSHLVSVGRLRQLLAAHSLQIEALHYGCWQGLPAKTQATQPMATSSRSETWGARLLWPWGACYFLEASKQVVGAKLLQAHWQTGRQFLGSSAPALTPSSSSTPKQP